jgi:hypothetical protein
VSEHCASNYKNAPNFGLAMPMRRAPEHDVTNGQISLIEGLRRRFERDYRAFEPIRALSLGMNDAMVA